LLFAANPPNLCRIEAELAALKTPTRTPPSVSGKPTAQILAEEEANNRASPGWMKRNLRA
jgi:hypothetical protein